jgi:sporulation protein YlmC with PRC-barrel domain
MTALPVKKHRGELRDARLHLLDRQLIDADGAPVGIVDDLVLTGIEVDTDIAPDAVPPRVTGLLSGQVVATRILGGSPPPSHLQEIPWDLVASVGVVVTLKPTDMSFDAGWIEEWLRDNVIRHIPGGRHAT